MRNIPTGKESQLVEKVAIWYFFNGEFPSELEDKRKALNEALKVFNRDTHLVDNLKTSILFNIILDAIR